jgi:hypothetical protein
MRVADVRRRRVGGTRAAGVVGMRHGMSTVTAGERTALGTVFHDAR